MISVAADLRDLFAGEIAKNKRLVIEIERIQALALQYKQEAGDWKVKAEKHSLDADLNKRENLALQKEIQRLNCLVARERADRQDMEEQVQDLHQQWRKDSEASSQKIEELRSVSEAFAKTIKDLETKLAIAERPPTQMIDTVNAVRSAAEVETKLRLQTQETYYERRLQLLESELEECRKQYSDLRLKVQSTQMAVDNAAQHSMEAENKVPTDEAASSKRTEEQSRPTADRSSSKLSVEMDEDDTLYLLSPRPGSTMTYNSEASAEIRRHLQVRSTRPRSHKMHKSKDVLDAAITLVARPMSAPIKNLDKASNSASSLAPNGSAKAQTYIGDGADYFETLFGGRKQVKFGAANETETQNPNQNQNHNRDEQMPAIMQDASTSGTVLTMGGAIRISCVHPDGIFIRLRNAAQSTEEVGGHLLMQLVGGQQAAMYRFVPSASVPPHGIITVWAGGNLSPENIGRLSTMPGNIVWKELEVWGAGNNCTTVFAKPSGEALCWVHGAVLETTSVVQVTDDTRIPIAIQEHLTSIEQVEEQVQVSEQIGSKKAADIKEEVIRKPSISDESQRRSKSPYHMHHFSEERRSSSFINRRPSTSKVRVDELDLNNGEALGNGGGDRAKTIASLSVSDTLNLIKANTKVASSRKLVAQGLQVLKAQHNLRFQPPVINATFPLASS